MIVLVFPSVCVAHTAGGDVDEEEDGDEHGKHGKHDVCVAHTAGRHDGEEDGDVGGWWWCWW